MSSVVYAPVADKVALAGLTRTEVQARLRRFGPNLLAIDQRPSRWAEFVSTFANAPALTLLAAAAIAGLLGQHWNAALIAFMVLLSGVINYVQWHRSQVSTERLKNKVAATADVTRDGSRGEIPAAELVPGDLLHLSAGDLVPADAALLETRDLHVIESALTGEAFPVEKSPAAPGEVPANVNKVFFGTAIASGYATAEVLATGEKTEFANVITKLKERPQPSEFQEGIANYSRMITKTVVVLAIVVAGGVLLLGRPPLEGLLFAVALAVGLAPEFLPMIVTVSLARAALRMSGNHVIVKHLPSIQQLGSVDVFCCDKTGTLTEGVMHLEHHVNADGTEDEEVFQLAYFNSYFHLGVQSKMDTALRKKGEERNPLDAAILAHEHLGTRKWRRVDEIPFDFERRAVTVVLGRDGTNVLIAKGAPESLLARSRKVLSGGKILELTPGSRDGINLRLAAWAQAGYRAIAVCKKEVPHKEHYATADENDLIFCGVLLFTDPVVPDVLATIHRLRKDGVELKILTGDQKELTARVCRQIGIAAPQVLTGDELDRLTPDAYARAVQESQVFARLTPQQKYRIIDSLRHQGHVVGYLGDGINDAPSIRLADVGISVAGAVDVARDAADVVLTEHKLTVLHQTIVEGRRAFANLMKYIFMSASSNFGNVLSIAAASFFLPFLPMTASQVLMNNLLYESSQVAIPLDTVHPSALRHPHRWDVGLIRRFMLTAGPISSIFDFVTFGLLIFVWHANETVFRTAWFIESLASQILVLLVVRSSQPFWRQLPGRWVALNTGLCLLIGTALPFSPWSGRLGFTALPLPLGLSVVAIVLSYLLMMECVKATLLRRWWVADATNEPKSPQTIRSNDP